MSRFLKKIINSLIDNENQSQFAAVWHLRRDFGLFDWRKINKQLFLSSINRFSLQNPEFWTGDKLLENISLSLKVYFKAFKKIIDIWHFNA